jgi:hypothetical protein
MSHRIVQVFSAYLCVSLRSLRLRGRFDAETAEIRRDYAEISEKLAADGDAQGADIAAGIERAQRDGVLARSK